MAQASNSLAGVEVGQLLYPDAIIPGTMGDTSCCGYNAGPESNIPLGCTDPNAMNYNDPVNYPENIPCSSALEGGWLVEEYGGAILEEPVLITDCQENGSCVYGQYYEIWCCNYDLGGSFSTPCEDVAVYSEQAYESAMDSSYGLCQDTQELCISETPCTT